MSPPGPSRQMHCSDTSEILGRVEMWRSGCRLNISVSDSFVWRCLSVLPLTPFPHPAHRTGHADFPHPALGQDFTPSPTARRARARSDVQARSARTGADRAIVVAFEGNSAPVVPVDVIYPLNCLSVGNTFTVPDPIDVTGRARTPGNLISID